GLTTTLGLEAVARARAPQNQTLRQPCRTQADQATLIIRRFSLPRGNNFKAKSEAQLGHGNRAGRLDWVRKTRVRLRLGLSADHQPVEFLASHEAGQHQSPPAWRVRDET